MKKILFYISGAIHNNIISEILTLFEYFRNMYPCHRRFRKHPLKEKRCKFKIDKVTYSKSQSGTTFNDSENKRSLYP